MFFHFRGLAFSILSGLVLTLVSFPGGIALWRKGGITFRRTESYPVEPHHNHHRKTLLQLHVSTYISPPIDYSPWLLETLFFSLNVD